MKNKALEEAWSGEKPSVGYFKVFGCIAYAHVADNIRAKLDESRTNSILLSVSENPKAYQLYNPVNKKIIVSQDAVFEVDSCWNWREDYASLIQSKLDLNKNESNAEVDDDQEQVIEEDTNEGYEQ